mgnify:CR=1 FL=1
MANTDMRVLTLAFFCLGVGGVEVEDFLRSFMPAADLTELTLDFADLAEPIDDEARLRASLAGEGRDWAAPGGGGGKLRGGRSDEGFGNLGGVIIILGGGDIISAKQIKYKIMNFDHLQQ